MKVIIIGGGIGGLTFALALNRHGIESEVYEAAPEIRPVGAGIMLGPNASGIYQRLGLIDRVAAAGQEPATFASWLQNGREVQRGTQELFRERYGFRTLGIERAALHDVLLRNLRHGQLKLGMTFERFEQDPEGITAWFEDGSSARADVLVGADGIWSRVREQLFGPTQYRYSRQTCWRGLADCTLQGTGFEDSAGEIWGNTGGRRFGFLQTKEKRVYFFITEKSPAGGRDNPATLKQELAAMLAGFPSVVPHVLAATPVERIIRSDLSDYAPLPAWHTGGVGLLGDAGHATTPNLGQGACQAIESAYVLAEQLATAPDVPEAFRQYEALRMEKAHFVTNMSWTFGSVVNIGGVWGRFVRNTLLPLVPLRSSLKMLDRIYKLNY